MPAKIPKAEKSNLTLRASVKHPAMKLAAELGYSFSEFVERLLEMQLHRHGRIKLSWLDQPVVKEKAAPKERPSSQD